jgi:hypothetical protein
LRYLRCSFLHKSLPHTERLQKAPVDSPRETSIQANALHFSAARTRRTCVVSEGMCLVVLRKWRC